MIATKLRFLVRKNMRKEIRREKDNDDFYRFNKTKPLSTQKDSITLPWMNYADQYNNMVLSSRSMSEK